MEADCKCNIEDISKATNFIKTSMFPVYQVLVGENKDNLERALHELHKIAKLYNLQT